MKSVKQEVRAALDAAIEQGSLAQKLRRLLLLDDDKLAMLAPVLESLEQLVDDGGEPESHDNEHRQYVISQLAQIIRMTATGSMSDRLVQHLVTMHGNQVTAAAELPRPFGQSHVVMGALALMVRARRGIRHNYDLPSCADHWKKRLGELTGSWGGDRHLDIHPGLTPVAFVKGIDFGDSRLNQQFFGWQPALRSFRKHQTNDRILFYRALKKWPLEDIYAFAPIPTWAACHKGEGLWLADHTWPEQQAELLRLRRLHKSMYIRFATMAELMFIDVCMRLATGGSPMEINRFRCEHPIDSGQCMTYGGVDQYGAEIAVERLSSDHGGRVMPLFIPQVTKEVKVTPTTKPA